MEGPVFSLNGEIRPGALDVDKGDEDVGDDNLCSLDDTGNEFGELGVLIGASGGVSARRGWGDTESEVDDLNSRLRYLFYESQVSNRRVYLIWKDIHTNEAPVDLQVEKLSHLGGLIHPHFGLASWTIDILLWGWKALRIFNRFIMAKITGISDLGLYCRFMLLRFEHISYHE